MVISNIQATYILLHKLYTNTFSMQMELILVLLSLIFYRVYASLLYVLSDFGQFCFVTA